MGCNCKKKQTPEPIKVPQTPEEQLNQELKIWGGGIDIKISLDETINNEGPESNGGSN